MAGTAIAVALVPPVCVMGLMIAANDHEAAQGSGLLYLANLLGILIGGLIVLAAREPYFQDKLRRSRRSRLPVLLSISLLVFIGENLLGLYDQYLNTTSSERLPSAGSKLKSGLTSTAAP